MSPAALITLPSPDALGEHVASKILARIDAAGGKPFLLGAPTGRTPRPILTAISKQLAAKPRDLSNVTLVMMDEYLVPKGDALAWAPASNDWACHAYVAHEYLPAFNASLPGKSQLRNASVWFPDPAHPDAYEKQIADAGGVDFFLLASGASDGHVAFNQPGTPRDSRTRVVPLSDTTRADNLKTHPDFGSLDNVPKFGVTAGIATIAAAKSAAMVVWGPGKRETVRRMRAAVRYDAQWPATVIHEIPNGEIIADAEAAAERTRD
jgi:glucosamine-6-phosphate deaminase